MKVGIIVGSIRDGRIGAAAGDFVHRIAAAREGGAEYELIDLDAFDVPLLTSGTHPMMANKQYDDAAVQAWSAAIDACDAYVFVTPEYNHSVPGAMKNAVDSLGGEWVGKPVAFVGYGSVGGVRAIEHWRQIISNFSMPNVRAEVNLSLFTDWTDGEFTPGERREAEVGAMLDALEQLAATVRG